MVKIAIDAGHGINTKGKRCLKSIDSKETREWWLNDRIADRLQKKLAEYNKENPAMYLGGEKIIVYR